MKRVRKGLIVYEPFNYGGIRRAYYWQLQPPHSQKRATFSGKRYTVSSVWPVIITNLALTPSRHRTSRLSLTCSEMTGNLIGQLEIYCISPPNKKAALAIGSSKSRPDGKLIMWWKGIMTNSRKRIFDEKIKIFNQ